MGDHGVALELRPAYAFGDVDRAYFVSVLLDDPDPSDGDLSDLKPGDTFWIDTLVPGRGGSLSLGISSTRDAWLEPGVAIGAQVGVTDLFTAWESFDPAGEPVDGGSKDRPGWARQLQLLVEPRARILPYREGPVIPYGVVGLDVRFLGHPEVPNDLLQPDGVELEDYDPQLLRHLPVTALALGVGGRWKASPNADLGVEALALPTLLGTERRKDTDRTLSILPDLPSPDGWVFRLAVTARWHL